MIIDWAALQKKEYTLYPEGTYKVRIKDYETTKAATGTDQIRWRAEIIDHPDYAGEPIVDHCALTEAALWRLAAFVSCHVDITALPKMEVGTTAFWKIIGQCLEKTMYWRVIQSTYNGRTSNKIAEYVRDPESPLGDGSIEVSEEDLPEFLNDRQQQADM